MKVWLQWHTRKKHNTTHNGYKQIKNTHDSSKPPTLPLPGKCLARSMAYRGASPNWLAAACGERASLYGGFGSTSPPVSAFGSGKTHFFFSRTKHFFSNGPKTEGGGSRTHNVYTLLFHTFHTSGATGTAGTTLVVMRLYISRPFSEYW